MTFDPWKQASLNNGLEKLKSVNIRETPTTVDDIKKLAGISNNNVVPSQPTVNKAQIMREQNIRPGDEAWFKLWFDKPHLTDPFNKKR